MDTRTAAALCMTDLASLIEDGDFRRFRMAEVMVEVFVASIQPRQRALALSQLTADLARLDYADRPEADGLLRAIRAAVRRQQELGFTRRLTALAAGHSCGMRRRPDYSIRTPTRAGPPVGYGWEIYKFKDDMSPMLDAEGETFSSSDKGKEAARTSLDRWLKRKAKRA